MEIKDLFIYIFIINKGRKVSICLGPLNLTLVSMEIQTIQHECHLLQQTTGIQFHFVVKVIIVIKFSFGTHYFAYHILH